MNLTVTLPSLAPWPPSDARTGRRFCVVALLLLALSSAAPAADFEFRFWPGTQARKAPGFVSIDEGPCGEVATMRVGRLPPYQQSEPFAPERVLELGPGGKVLRRWSVPVDAVPHAVAGTELWFSFDSQVYRVDLKGTVNLETDPPPRDPAEEVECETPKEFQPSEYVGCWNFTDWRSRKPRVLAYEGVCS